MNVSAHHLMPVIRSALARGQRVNMTVTGCSMMPFIYNGDEVELESVPKPVPVHSASSHSEKPAWSSELTNDDKSVYDVASSQSEKSVSSVAPSRGAIILAQSREGHYVLHRIVRVEGDLFFLRGDAQKQCDSPYKLGDLSGRVTASVHNGHKRRHSRGLWRLSGLIWITCSPVCLLLFGIYEHLRRIIRKPLRDRHQHTI